MSLERTPRGHARRNALILGGIFVGAMLAGLGGYLLVDGAPPEDSDLALDEARVPDALNGYLLFEAGDEEPYHPDWELEEDFEEDPDEEMLEDEAGIGTEEGAEGDEEAWVDEGAWEDEEATDPDPGDEGGMEEDEDPAPASQEDAADDAFTGEEAEEDEEQDSEQEAETGDEDGDEAGDEAGESSEPAEDLLRGKRYDPALVAKVLERNQALLERFDRTVALPAFQFPEWDVRDDMFGRFGRFRKMPDIVFVRAWAQARAGDSVAASASALAVVRFGARYEAAARTNVHFLLGTAFRSLAYERMEALLPHLELERAAWIAMLQDFGRLAPSRTSPSLSIRGEYGYQKASLQALRSGEISIDGGFGQEEPRGPWRHRIFLLPNETLGLCAEAARIALSAVAPTGLWKTPDWSALEEAAEMHPWFPGRNGAGRGGIPSMISGHEGLIMYHRVSWYRHHLLHAALALHAFEAVEGRPAASLEELQPDWLPESPEDPATGTPLHYDPARRLLWYAGLDGIDTVDGDALVPTTHDDDPEAFLQQPCYRVPSLAEERR